MITDRFGNLENSWGTKFSAYGAMFVTVVVFLLLFIGITISGLVAEPPPAFNNLMETVKALAMVCAGYWVGSSNSGQKKDETIARAQTALAQSSPAVAVPVAIIPTETTTIIRKDEESPTGSKIIATTEEKKD